VRKTRWRGQWLLSVADAAILLRVEPALVMRFITRETLPVVDLPGGTLRIRLNDLLRFIRRHTRDWRDPEPWQVVLPSDTDAPSLVEDCLISPVGWRGAADRPRRPRRGPRGPVREMAPVTPPGRRRNEMAGVASK
jgi:hypothetical protein